MRQQQQRQRGLAATVARGGTSLIDLDRVKQPPPTIGSPIPAPSHAPPRDEADRGPDFREDLKALPGARSCNAKTVVADRLFVASNSKSFNTNLLDKTGQIREAPRESITLLKERRSALVTAAVTGQIKIEK